MRSAPSAQPNNRLEWRSTDRGQVTPLAAHLEVGDIGDPDLIGAFDRDRMCPALHAGGNRAGPALAVVDSRRTGANPVFAHQSLDRRRLAVSPRWRRSAWMRRTPIGLATVRMRGADPLSTRLASSTVRWLGGRAAQGVVARGTDAQHPAHLPHRVQASWWLPDEGEDVAFRAEVNADGFLKGRVRARPLVVLLDTGAAP